MLTKRESRMRIWMPVAAGLLVGFVVASSLDGLRGYLGCSVILAMCRPGGGEEGVASLARGWGSHPHPSRPGALPPLQALVLQLERLQGDYLKVVRDSLTGAALKIPAHQPRSKTADPSKLAFRKFRRDFRHLGLDWPQYGYTLSGQLRLDNVRESLEAVLSEGIPGSFVECGVWRGGASIYAAAVLHAYGVTDRDVHLVDSFKAAPLNDTKPKAATQEEFLGVSLQEVMSHFRSFGLLGPRVHFHQGYFRYVLPRWRGGDRSPIAVLRLGGGKSQDDITHQLYNLWDDVAPGGFVLLDDYGAQPGTQQAVQAFMQQQGMQVVMEDVDGSGAWLRKSPGRPGINRTWYTAWNTTLGEAQARVSAEVEQLAHSSPSPSAPGLALF